MGMDWTSATGLLRLVSVPGAVVGAVLAAVFLAAFFALARQRLAGAQFAGGIAAFVLGAAAFAPSIADVQVPLQSAASRWAMTNLVTANTLVLSIPAILLTGIVQEPAKLLAVALGMLATPRRARRGAGPALGALAGAGYGAMEAAIVLSYALAAIPSGTFPWLATIERASAVVFHLSLTGIAMAWWARGTARRVAGLVAVVLAHIGVDYLPVLLGAGVLGVAALEAIVGVFSLALLAYLVITCRGAKRGE